MASESHDNLLLQADWDDSALVAAFERHYNKYNECHGHGGGRPKKIARTQANLHVHNPRPREAQPDSVTADSKADEEGEIEETVPDMEQVEDDIREADEEEEGAIIDEETPSQKSNISDGTSPRHIPEQHQSSVQESVRCSGPAHPGLMNANPGAAMYTPPLPTHDPELASLLLSWYYAGYYTGRHEARQS